MAWQSVGDASTRGRPAGTPAREPGASGEPGDRRLERLPVVGVVLAGGASRRMGSDKALLTVGGETLAARAAHRLLAVCSHVVVADGGRGLLPGLPSVPDGPGGGPAAGILGAAHACPGRPLLALACDLPAVPSELLAELVMLATAPVQAPSSPADFPVAPPRPDTARGGESAAADWVLPRWERGVEPLCALYQPAAIAALAAAVERGMLALHRLAAAAPLRVQWLDGEPLRRFGVPADVFLNLNSPADLERWLAGGPRAKARRRAAPAQRE
jgi:molybdopterin-guanine dinucleotide biosynthesis protein A